MILETSNFTVTARESGGSDEAQTIAIGGNCWGARNLVLHRAGEPVFRPAIRPHRCHRYERRDGTARSRLPRGKAGLGRREISAQPAPAFWALGRLLELRARLWRSHHPSGRLLRSRQLLSAAR